MDLQKMFDAICDAQRTTRSNYHVTLGELRTFGAAYPDARFVLLDADMDEGVAKSIGNPHAYRGYYSDLSFEEVRETVRGRDIIAMCNHISETTFVGYKGGDYRYGEETPIWVAPWGCTGPALMNLAVMPTHPDDGGGVIVVLETREID